MRGERRSKEPVSTGGRSAQSCLSWLQIPHEKGQPVQGRQRLADEIPRRSNWYCIHHPIVSDFLSQCVRHVIKNHEVWAWRIAMTSIDSHHSFSTAPSPLYLQHPLPLLFRVHPPLSVPPPSIIIASHLAHRSRRRQISACLLLAGYFNTEFQFRLELVYTGVTETWGLKGFREKFPAFRLRLDYRWCGVQTSNR
jgi:hypothetical protein